jgi:opacity protein-like surface antigen
MRTFAWGFVFLSLFSCTAAAQEAPKAEVFGGYSYFRLNPRSTFMEGINLNGWNASLAGNVNDWFGIVGDFSGQYSKPRILGVDLNIKTHSFLFGPRFSYRRNAKITPFAHTLFGATRVTGEAVGISDHQTGFAMALGGGVDAKLNDHVAIRIVQADYLLTRLKGESIACIADPLLPPCPAPQTESQHNVRLSFGAVFRFGH